MSEQREYAYRFEYADKSACEIMPDGRMFLTWPNGKREEKHGNIDNRIPLLIGQAAKPRQDEIASLRAQLAAATADADKICDSYAIENQRLSDQLASARKALEPFAACVFNDNGDITVTTSDLRIEHYVQAKATLTDEKGNSK